MQYVNDSKCQRAHEKSLEKEMSTFNACEVCDDENGCAKEDFCAMFETPPHSAFNPCPFCGEPKKIQLKSYEAEFVPFDCDFIRTYAVQCQCCFGSTGVHFTNLRDAVEAWNTRASL